MMGRGAGGEGILRQTLIRLSQQRRLQQLSARNPLARKMARRFVAGETLSEAIEAARGLNRRSLSVTLDHLGENVMSRMDAAESARAAAACLAEISRAEVASNISVKLTQFGLDVEPSLAYDNMRQVLDAARETKNFVRIDMEASAYVQRTLDIFLELWKGYRNVGAVLQSYLFRSEADLERLIEAGARVRLVKGAYAEPPLVAYQRKQEVDANFIRLMRALLSRGIHPAIATHDPKMIQATIRFAQEHGIDTARYEFQMLYGVRRDLQARLRSQGHNVRVYVPYGTQWYPYLMRRMAERPANLIFVLANIAREGVGSLGSRGH
jgi:proline dehydrogenase